MSSKLDLYYNQAIDLLHELCTESGFMASAISSDNYKRVWARDSMICGIAGLLAKEESIIKGLKNSLLTLAKNQHELGMIPSNVFKTENKIQSSFGSLVGRVDSNCWFVIGACLYYNSQKDAATWAELNPAVKKSLRFLQAVEYNGKGWLYTPLSGNWADEYPIQGYTLYDNALYYWARNCYAKINSENDFNHKKTQDHLMANFWPSEEVTEDLRHHKEAFNDALKKNQQHLCCYILPGSYDMRFDCAGHGIALANWHLSSNKQEHIRQFIINFKKEINTILPPAFWPVITDKDVDWDVLRNNYSYAFKNYPYQFHNGGIWPVWLGWLCLGLRLQGMQETAKLIIEDFMKLLPEGSWNFNEYFTSDSLEPLGKLKMGFSASGIILLKSALDDKFEKSDLML